MLLSHLLHNPSHAVNTAHTSPCNLNTTFALASTFLQVLEKTISMKFY